MAIIAKLPDSSFAPCPEGLHLAVCVDVQDLGIVATVFGDKHKVRFSWQIDGDNVETGRPYEAFRSYNNSLHEKAALRKDLESWAGRHFTPAELAGLDLETRVGQTCQIQIVHVQGDDDITYANVTAVVPAPKKGPRLVPRGYVRRDAVAAPPPAPPAPPGYSDFLDDLTAAAGGGQRVFDMVWGASAKELRAHLMAAAPEQWTALRLKAAA